MHNPEYLDCKLRCDISRCIRGIGLIGVAKLRLDCALPKVGSVLLSACEEAGHKVKAVYATQPSTLGMNTGLSIYTIVEVLNANTTTSFPT